jgi:hypothetical protein
VPEQATTAKKNFRLLVDTKSKETGLCRPEELIRVMKAIDTTSPFGQPQAHATMTLNTVLIGSI